MNKHQPLLSPLIRLFKVSYTTWPIYTKNAWRVSQSLVPRSEVFALPDVLERATKKPHAICIYNAYKHQSVPKIRIQQWLYTSSIYTPEGYLRLPCSAYIIEVCEVSEQQKQSAVNAFSYIWNPHSRLLFRKGKARLRDGFGCKGNKLYEKQRTKHEKLYLFRWISEMWWGFKS